MTTKILLSFLVILFISMPTFGQQTIQGRIVNSNTQESIPYANIGFTNANVGTISNPDGSFSLYIPANLLNDSLLVSSMGFGSKHIPLQYLLTKKKITIFLDQRIVALTPVIVSTKREKLKTFELGNANFKGGVLQTDTLYAGRSVCLLIENTEANIKKGITFPAFIEKVKLRIYRNNLPSFKYRIRLNEVDPLTKQPGQDLLLKSIVIQSSMKNGWLTFDLADLNMEIDKSFFITFEQILDVEDRTLIANDYRKFLTEHPNKVQFDTVEVDGRKEVRKLLKGGGIDLSGTFIGIAISKAVGEKYISYVKETSFGDWKKVRGIVAATVTLSNYPDPSVINQD